MDKKIVLNLITSFFITLAIFIMGFICITISTFGLYLSILTVFSFTTMGGKIFWLVLFLIVWIIVYPDKND